uniref:Uncharacterized protein n=1 Tax=Oryza brachyantha TaxID=4533 RepID=J3L0R1_ORYBR
MLHQFELAQSVQFQPCNAISFFGPTIICVSVFPIDPLGQPNWFFAPNFGVAMVS